MSEKWTMERALREKPPTLHPLAGCTPGSFCRKYRDNRPFDRRSRIPRLTSSALVLLRAPFTAWQRLRRDRIIFNETLENGPIFIVGHWRSGTTHLHNTLSQDPQFAWISFLQTLLPNEMTIRAPFTRGVVAGQLPERRGTDNVALSVDSPQEEEWALANLNDLSFFNCYYFPRNYLRHFRRGVLLEDTTEAERQSLERAYERLVKTLHFVHEGKPLLFKNPSATARMPMLKRLFPNARFIHIVRNPYDVYASSLARHPRLMHAFAWQRFDDIDFESICYACYEELMKRYLEDREKIPAEDLLELTYEDFVANPARELDQIYERFNIPRGPESIRQIESYLDTQKTYEKNRHRLTTDQSDYIAKHFRFALDEWGYERPEPSSTEETKPAA